MWDEQIERDIKAGRLDDLADKWRSDYAAGKHSKLEPPPRPVRR